MSIKYDDNFISRFTREKGKTPIVFFLASNDKGDVTYQGYIYRLRKDGTGKARLFSWVPGEESGDMEFTRAFLSECKFYSNDEAWRSEADKLGMFEPLDPVLVAFDAISKAGLLGKKGAKQ